MADRQGNGLVAAVTGASSGIGRSFAVRLARSGHSVLLIGRDASRLQQVESEIRTAGGQAQTLVADLAQVDQIEAVAERLRELPRLDLLVNNAGFGTMGDFLTVDPRVHAEMLQVHCLATIRLTHAALIPMTRDAAGGIVNVSSMSAFLVAPGQVNYAATKAFLVSFSESLAAEVKGDGIRVQALCPGFTTTGFHDRPHFSKFDRRQISRALWMTADQVVDESLKGLARGRVVCIPGFKNRLITKLLTIPYFRRTLGSKVRKRHAANH